jgi:hypothetical protein
LKFTFKHHSAQKGKQDCTARIKQEPLGFKPEPNGIAATSTKMKNTKEVQEHLLFVTELQYK